MIRAGKLLAVTALAAGAALGASGVATADQHATGGKEGVQVRPLDQHATGGQQRVADQHATGVR
ncbi:hypothetical protein ACWD6I_19285 [Streptomyces sp. NPDC002454]|uniref:hypothetical protein n=1 Tax=Streptomyces sp. NPDC002490 TaxID=3154416 RepID=UPI00332B2FDC